MLQFTFTHRRNMRKMRQKNHGFMLEIWLKVHHFLTQISASRENINYIHNNILLPQSSVCGLGGLVRARKENKAVKYLPISCKTPKTKTRGNTIIVNFPTLTRVSTSQISTRFHHLLEIYSQPISVLNSLHVTYSFQSSLFYYP